MKGQTKYPNSVLTLKSGALAPVRDRCPHHAISIEEGSVLKAPVVLQCGRRFMTGR